ncbi:uncharacterized protein LOC110981594 isoform X2 [Acanthaster planci]|uniref:Uncharacterized protein LOC110981594 isoform X2 n=1 Tax=Acanthaster planci TaxID=133434 RepID=A0A8B7YNV4_ACAPL|nr:uncharacterized protein LOC110981594 isoform X2 [Acanthaster planci]
MLDCIDTMESARKPQLHDLRQRRLAYFDQRYPPTPPTEPKPSSNVHIIPERILNGRDGKKASESYGNAAYNKTGAIPKSHKKIQRDIDFLDANRRHGLNSDSMESTEEHGFSYQLVAAKKESVNQKLSSQEFEIHVSRDVDNLFQSNRTRPRTPGQTPKEKLDKFHPSVPVQSSAIDAASMDYERKLINDLQKPDRQKTNHHIRNSQGKIVGNSPWTHDHLDSRMKHLKRFLYKQDEAVSPAIKVAAEHDALHAQNILHQMSQVRKLRAQMHGELMSNFSEQEFGLNPMSKSDYQSLSSGEATDISSLKNGHVFDCSTAKHQEPSKMDVYSSKTDFLGASKSLSAPPANHSILQLEKEDTDADCTGKQDKIASNDNLDDEMTFDLGELQEAAKQGDDILRKYIQSLSKNLKKKKRLTESVGENTKNDFKPNVLEKDMKKQEEQLVEKKLSSLPGYSKIVNAEFSAEQDTGIAPAHESKTAEKSTAERQYRPKVADPSVTSRELQDLGLYQDLVDKKHNTPDHDATLLHIQCKSDQSRTDHLNGMVGDSTDDEDLGLITHRPQQRPLSPLKQVYVNNKVKHVEISDDSTHPVQKYQYNADNSPSDLNDLWLTMQPKNATPIENHSELEVHDNSQFSHDVHKSQLSSESIINSMEESEDDRVRKPPPSYEKLFSNSTALSSDNIPFPHPSGTEIGNFVCSEQSTDSDLDMQAHKNLKPKLMPNPPQEKKSNSSFKRQKPTIQLTTGKKSPKPPKTPERHMHGIREHHKRERESRRQLSACKSQSRSVEKDVENLQKFQKDVQGAYQSSPLQKEDTVGSKEIREVNRIFKTSSSKRSEKVLNVGPSGDSEPVIVAQRQIAKLCQHCSNIYQNNQSQCEVCGTLRHNKPYAPVESVTPSINAQLKDLSLGGDATTRSHLTTGSAWDIEISAQTRDKNFSRVEEDDESFVMDKIASFVPKLIQEQGVVEESENPGDPVLSDETGAGDASHSYEALPMRVDAWLAANNSSRLPLNTTCINDNSFGPPNHDNSSDQLQQSTEEDETEQKGTFDLPSQVNLSNHHLPQNGCVSSCIEDHELKQIKPLPSSEEPKRGTGRRESAKTKSSVSKSKTGQLIDQPMYNRRWATSSSTWGTRQSVGRVRSSLKDSTSGSPVMQRKRPSSAQHQVPLHKSEVEPRMRVHRTQPKSASWKCRDSKDVNSRQRSSDLKEEFLTVNMAQIDEGLASRALNASHSMLPLTLKLISDSPRGNDGLSIWELLPDEILLHVFRYLSYKDLIHCAASCSRFHRIVMDDSLWRTIKLHKRQLSDFSLTQIGERHPVNLSLTQCHSNIVTENGLRNLFRSCTDTLQELNVSGCTGGELTGDSLLLHASRCHHLMSLDASWCQATDNGLSAISESCHRLTSLCLNGCQSVSDECLTRVIKKHGKSLRVLEVLGCVQLSPETLQLIGCECRHLHTLNIGQCYKVTDECISQLVCYLRNLKHLDLRGCKQIRDTCVRKIVRNCKYLETLVLANCTHITNASLVEMATYLPTIRSLDVSGCKKVSNEGVRSLATCCHNLTSLDVSSTGVDNKSVSALANYCSKTLVAVRFNCCKDITEMAIVKLLKNCKKLDTLHLYGVKGLRNLGVLKLQYPCLQFE